MKKYITDRNSSLYRALEEYNRFIIAQYDINYEPLKFSEKTEMLIHRAINMRVAWYYDFINTTAKRVAVIIATAIVALATATFSIEALREPFITFIVETFEKFSKITFTTRDEADTFSLKLEPNSLAYIPSGFKKIYEENNEWIYIIEYRDNNYGTVYFEQQFKTDDPIIINTEHGEQGLIDINGIIGMYNYEPATEYTTIVWSDENYIYTIGGDIDKNELVKIAQMIK